MPKYRVHVFCDNCSDQHPMPISITLDGGPVKKESIGDVYAGKALSQRIATLMRNHIMCPNTQRWFTQEDNNQVFLVPIDS